MTRGWGVGRQGGTIVAAFALLVICGTPVFVSPAAAATKAVRRNGAAVSPRVRTAKPKTKTKKAATGRLGKRDYAEFALLVLAPFIVMALFLGVSGYRRESQVSHGP